MTRLAVWILLFYIPAAFAQNQETPGVSVSVTAAAIGFSTNGSRTDDGLDSSTRPAFRAVVSPTINLGSNWFLYAAESVTSGGYYTASGTGYTEDTVDSHLLQAFVGYTGRGKHFNWLWKAGQLTSAFGLAPSKYDDARMPLSLLPPSYLSLLPLRADQIPCGTADLVRQRGSTEVEFACGSEENDSYGMAPVTLYGLPGVEFELAADHIDARVQITNSSPSNPQNLLSSSQRPQATAGSGVRLPGGFHVGVSGFRGPYLDRSISSSLSSGTRWSSPKASGVGFDVQWFRKAWSVESEWDRFSFESPRFAVSPSATEAYLQAKRVLSPRLFAAGRFSTIHFGSVRDDTGLQSNDVWPTRKQIDCGLGYHLNPHQVIKIGGGITTFPSFGPNDWRYIASVELVTSITPISRSFR